MANFTGKAIKKAFISLLEERPLNEITVKDIVENCGINRNSFYYHFQDIPSLLEEIMEEEAEIIIKKYPTVNSIIKCFDAMVEFASRRKRAIMHIFRSVKREVFERNLMRVSDYFVRNYVNSALAEKTICEPDKKTIIDYYRCVCFGVILDWLNNGMNEEYAHSIRRIFLLKKDLAQEVAEMLQEQV